MPTTKPFPLPEGWILAADVSRQYGHKGVSYVAYLMHNGHISYKRIRGRYCVLKSEVARYEYILRTHGGSVDANVLKLQKDAAVDIARERVMSQMSCTTGYGGSDGIESTCSTN